MNGNNDYLTTWFQFEFSDPPEIGLKNGLRKFRIDYAADNIELSVGIYIRSEERSHTKSI